MKSESKIPAAQQPAEKVLPLVSGKIKFSIQESYEFVHPDEIKYIEGADNQSSVYLANKIEPLIISYNLKRLFDEKLLDPKIFLRVHVSYIINTNKVIRYVKECGGSIVLDSTDKAIPVSDKYRDEVMARIKAN